MGGRRLAGVLRHSFDFGAPLYGWVTAQRTWRDNAGHLTAIFPPSASPRVLDIGTGPGISIVGMHDKRPDASYIGLDIAAGMLAQAARRLAVAGLPAPLLRADALQLPFPDGTFDVVTGHSFLYLLPDPVALLADCVRVLVPGGRVAFMEPAAGRPALRALLAAHGREGRYLLSMAGWSLISRWEGPYTPDRFRTESSAAGLAAPEARSLLYAMGWLLTARRPLL